MFIFLLKKVKYIFKMENDFMYIEFFILNIMCGGVVIDIKIFR